MRRYAAFLDDDDRALDLDHANDDQEELGLDYEDRLLASLVRLGCGRKKGVGFRDDVESDPQRFSFFIEHCFLEAPHFEQSRPIDRSSADVV